MTAAGLFQKHRPLAPWLDDGDCVLYHGDALDVLRGLPDESVDCVVTSPPYWGLRDYGHQGQLGLEGTPDEYVAALVGVFSEARRVLAPAGTVWLNLGDTYAGNRSYQVPQTIGAKGHDYGSSNRGMTVSRRRDDAPVPRSDMAVEDLKAKDLVGIPWRVAFALQADGWWLRSDIIWAKPNPMPESVRDRPTKAHEYVFLLSKASRYYFDDDAVREEAAWERWGDQTNRKHEGQQSAAGWIGDHTKRELVKRRSVREGIDTHGGGQGSGSIVLREGQGKNIRSVWSIPTQPYPGVHFATYPEELVRRCVLAGCPERVCRVCGKPSEREVAVSYENPGNRTTNGPRSLEQRHESPGFAQRLEKRTETVGWSDCGHDACRPGVVLDPFVGSGTTCKVARDHGRHSIGIDLNADYLQMAARRLAQQSLLTEDAASTPVREQGPQPSGEGAG